jgi:hypothetical protein
MAAVQNDGGSRKGQSDGEQFHLRQGFLKESRRK